MADGHAADKPADVLHLAGIEASLEAFKVWLDQNPEKSIDEYPWPEAPVKTSAAGAR